MASSTPLRIWCNATLPDDAMRVLREGTAKHELLMAENLASSNLRSSPSDEQFTCAEVAFGQPDPAAMLAGALPLRWAHLTTEGSTR